MKKTKLLKVTGITLALTILVSFTASAGQWQQNATGWCNPYSLPRLTGKQELGLAKGILTKYSH